VSPPCSILLVFSILTTRTQILKFGLFRPSTPQSSIKFVVCLSSSPSSLSRFLTATTCSQVEGGYPTSISPSSAGDITTPLDSLPTNHLHGASPQLDLCLAMPSPSSSFSLSPFPDTPPTDGLVDINAIYHEPLDDFRKAEVHNFLLNPSFAWYQPSPQNYSTQPQSHFPQSGYGPTTHPQNLSTQLGQPYLANATCELNHLQAALLPTQSGIESHITASGYAHNLSPTPEDFEKGNTFGEAPYFPL
jgi:hypothetical protein